MIPPPVRPFSRVSISISSFGWFAVKLLTLGGGLAHPLALEVQAM